jgi:hypothetical protein
MTSGYQMAAECTRYGTGAYKPYFHDRFPFFGWPPERACRSSDCCNHGFGSGGFAGNAPTSSNTRTIIDLQDKQECSRPVLEVKIEFEKCEIESNWRE